MSKLDDLKRAGGSNAAESMGAGIVTPVHGARPGGVPTLPSHLRGVSKAKNVAEIAIDRIGRDEGQPREEFDPVALGRLAESLKTKGQLQPIRVRWDAARDQYVVICGERRWRAAGLAGLTTMQAVISEGPVSQSELLGLQMIENLLREDLKPIEQAKGFRALMDGNEWSVSQLARELAIDHSGISRALALLELPASVQSAVEAGELAPSVAYEVSKLDDPDDQTEVVEMAVSGGMSRAEVVKAVRSRAARSAGKPKGRGGKPKKVTTRTFRSGPGPKVTVDHAKGLDLNLIISALSDVLDRVREDLARELAA